jgi:hypothetical protein
MASREIDVASRVRSIMTCVSLIVVENSTATSRRLHIADVIATRAQD